MIVAPSSQSSRVPFGRSKKEVLALPNLIKMQLDSFRWFQTDGLKELFEEINPIQDFSGKMELEFGLPPDPFGEPKYKVDECRELDLTYAAPLSVRAKLRVVETGEVIEKTIFMGDFPLMTPEGTFIINGSERVVVSQLVRSPGVYFTVERDAGRPLYMAKLIPNRGAWLEFETSNRDLLTVKVDRKRRIPVTTLLRAIGFGSDDAIRELFQDVDTHPEHRYIESTIDKDVAPKTEEGGLLEVYKKLRPGDPPTVENARSLIKSLFFNPRRYDLGRVGRYKLNRRLELDPARRERVLTPDDLVAIVRTLIQMNNAAENMVGTPPSDDIDHLGNRRVRAVGELLQGQFRIGLLRMERVVKERMTIQDPSSATPSALINIRPVVAAIKEFFGGSQLSQFMQQTNPLDELTHKRRLSALGPGGLSRDRAGFDVRDVHQSHYGRICPIETPEGPNIGLIGSLATYGTPNEFGFIETPYRRVFNKLMTSDPLLKGRMLAEKVVDPETGEIVAESGKRVDAPLAARLAELTPAQLVRIRPYVTDQVVYMTADQEEKFVIAQANVPLTPEGEFIDERASVRAQEQFKEENVNRTEYMDVSPRQIVSVATALIPFLEHDDANRALMGANMQRQAVGLLRPDAPIVGTGMEKRAAQDSGQVLVAQRSGEVIAATASCVSVRPDDLRTDDPNMIGLVLEETVVEPATGAVVAVEGTTISRDVARQLSKLPPQPVRAHQEYRLRKFQRSNQGTCINQRPTVRAGQHVDSNDVLADSSSTENGELALGQNVLVAFMSWEGGNYEDAILISEELMREDVFTSIHMEKHEVDARDTKLGPEEITRDIPNVGEDGLKNLDERGIVYVGAEVAPNDILVGKITPKGETELTAEERLLRAIFGEKAREVKDTSLRVPQGERGKVVEVKVFSRAEGHELPPGVNQLVRVSIAQKRKISEGDKMAGRHGNKGVISRIIPAADMPFLPDGRPIQIILNPLGVPSRMNIGQILETNLGWAAHVLGYKVASPVFEGASEDEIHNQLKLAGLPENGKVTLYDGRTGEPFDRPVTVGYIYMLKLAHLVEDKIHARSTGPYSLVTQQPLGGKAQFGGQRFGEMEVWALEAYGAANILQELLTVKSDDVIGRVKTYESIVKGETILEPGVPESFKVLVKELQSLGLAVEVLNDEEQRISFADDTAGSEPPSLELAAMPGVE